MPSSDLMPTMLVDRDRSWTWAQHHARACRVAHALRSERTGAGSRVAFLDRNSAEYFETLFGCAFGGIVNVAVNWRLAPEEMAAVIDDAHAEVLVVHRDYLHCLAGMSSELPTVRRIVADRTMPDPSTAQISLGRVRSSGIGSRTRTGSPTAPRLIPGTFPMPAEASLQLYTSGTTGLPKGVMLSNSNLATAIGGADQSFQIDDNVVSLVAMPLFHIGGSGWALCAMSRGGKSVILRDADPSELVRLVETERISSHVRRARSAHVPARDRRGIEDTDISSLREIFYGASPIAEEVLVIVPQGLRVQLHPGLRHDRDHGRDLRAPRRRPRPGRSAPPSLALGRKAVRGRRAACRRPRHRTEMSRSARSGELWTRSPYTMLGYWEKPDETQRAIDADGWLQDRRCRLPRRRGLRVPARPDQGHDRVAVARTSIRPRSRTCCSHISGGRRRGRSASPTTVGRDREGDRRDAYPPSRTSEGDLAPEFIEHCRSSSGALQVPDVGRLRRDASEEPFRQDSEARATRALLAGPRPSHPLRSVS